MGDWVVNIVGKVEEEIEDIVAKVVTAAQEAGHKIQSVRVTTDAGEKTLDVTPPAEAAPAEPVVEEPSDPTPAPDDSAEAEPPPA